MEQKIINQYKVKDEGLFNEQQREWVDKFIKSFDKHFEINYDKDVNITVSIKLKEVGSQSVQIINVTVKDTEVTIYDPAQEKLFGDGDVKISIMRGDEKCES